MNKSVMFLTLSVGLFIGLANKADARIGYGLPTIFDTEEGKWLKQKVYQGTNSLCERSLSRGFCRSANVMKRMGWDQPPVWKAKPRSMPHAPALSNPAEWRKAIESGRLRMF